MIVLLITILLMCLLVTIVDDYGYLSELLTEKQRRTEHEAQYTPGDKPGWNQLKIHRSLAKILLIFGGNQSGKSHSASKEIEWRARGKHPYKRVPPTPVLVWCISASYATLRNGIYRHLRNNFADWEIASLGPKIQGHDMHSSIKLKNGSIIEFYSARNADDAREKLQAAKVDVISIDEEIPEVVYRELRMRQLAAFDPVVIISATLVNSEQYILDLEEQAAAEEAEIKEKGGDLTRANITLTRLDSSCNPSVNQDVLNDEMERMDEETIEYRIKGKSRRFAGLVYKDFDRRLHVVQPFTIPRNWPRYMAFDPGIRRAGIIYCAISPNGKKYFYKEFYLSGVALHEIVGILRSFEGWVIDKRRPLRVLEGNSAQLKIPNWKPGPSFTPITERIIDDKKQSRLISGEWGILAQLSLYYGITCTPAIKHKMIGIERCRQSLATRETQIFSTCHNFIKEIERYRYHQDSGKSTQNEKPQEPIKRDDHLLDPWRYLLVSEPEWQDQAEELIDPVLVGQDEDGEEIENSVDWDVANHIHRKKYTREQETIEYI